LVLLPSASVRLRSVRVMLLFTLKRRTAFPPLMVTVRPDASRVVFVEMTFLLVSVIMPSQANVIVPPPVSTASRFASVQFVTTPPARPGVVVGPIPRDSRKIKVVSQIGHRQPAVARELPVKRISGWAFMAGLINDGVVRRAFNRDRQGADIRRGRIGVHPVLYAVPIPVVAFEGPEKGFIREVPVWSYEG
jgi:hypothetical protein